MCLQDKFLFSQTYKERCGLHPCLKKKDKSGTGELPNKTKIVHQRRNHHQVYLRPNGSNASAFAIIPVNPDIANGCRGSTVFAAMPVLNTPFPRKYSVRLLPKALDCRIKTGKAGSCAAAVISMEAVILNPLTRKASDAVIPSSGPRIEKSNIDLRVGGGDLKEVIVPSTPS
jgi:hypothetical protein